MRHAHRNRPRRPPRLASSLRRSSASWNIAASGLRSPTRCESMSRSKRSAIAAASSESVEPPILRVRDDREQQTLVASAHRVRAALRSRRRSTSVDRDARRPDVPPRGRRLPRPDQAQRYILRNVQCGRFISSGSTNPSRCISSPTALNISPKARPISLGVESSSRHFLRNVRKTGPIRMHQCPTRVEDASARAIQCRMKRHFPSPSIRISDNRDISNNAGLSTVQFTSGISLQVTAIAMRPRG